MSRRPRVRAATAVITLVAAAAALVGACASSGDGTAAAGGTDTVGTETPVDHGTLVYGVGFDVNTWSPFVERWLASGQLVAQAFYEPLATFDASGAVVPYLAESITSSEDFTEWTIALRPDIRFHDGAPLDAEAVKRNLDTQGLGSGTNLAPVNDVASVEVIDDLHVLIRTERPWATFPVHLTGQLGNQAGYMTSPAQIEAADPHALPVGTGPFEAVAWEQGRSLTAKRNDDYWRPGLPHLDAVEFRFIPDEAMRLDELRSGTLDVAVLSDGALLDEADLLDPAPGGDVTTVAGTDDPLQHFVVLNTATAPTDDPEVRRALALALDRDAIAEAEGPDAVRSDGPVAADSPWRGGVEPVPHDPDAAAATIEAWEAANGPLSITLTAATDPASIRRQQAVADAWQDVGVDVVLETDELRNLPVRVANGETQATVFEKFAGVDPDSYTMFLLSTNVNPIGVPSLNLAHLTDPELDEAVWRGRSSPERGVRLESYTSIGQRLADDAAFIWLAEVAPRVVASSRVRGIDGAALPGGGTAMPLISGRHGLGQVWLAPTS